MEKSILVSLEYNVTIPTAHTFLVRYLKAARAHKKIVQLSWYILDGTLQSYNLLHFLPSQLAAASVYLARRAVGTISWSTTLVKNTRYCSEEVIIVARAILHEKRTASNDLQACNKKHSSSRYGHVATCQFKLNF